MGDWRDGAVCTSIDPELFAGEDGRTQASRQAKKICETCPVKQECLTFALDNGMEFGIYGGKGPREREDILRSQGRKLSRQWY